MNILHEIDPSIAELENLLCYLEDEGIELKKSWPGSFSLIRRVIEQIFQSVESAALQTQSEGEAELETKSHLNRWLNQNR